MNLPFPLLKERSGLGIVWLLLVGSVPCLSGCLSLATRIPEPIPTLSASVQPTPTPIRALPPGSVRFTDVARQAGLRYRWTIPGKRPINALQGIGNGCCFTDYDGDGNLDILLVGSPLALYRGDGKGRFTDTTRTMGLDVLRGHFLGVAVGDYDNDGFDDLYLSGYR
ncbi:MAG: VCBS repeat-containing protein, partial [Capsulimonadales bacterium]|nr:VCBS repeat-containing protein [Capsulimonadales bacterium]